jgi:hypothetical protein
LRILSVLPVVHLFVHFLLIINVNYTGEERWNPDQAETIESQRSVTFGDLHARSSLWNPCICGKTITASSSSVTLFSRVESPGTVVRAFDSTFGCARVIIKSDENYNKSTRSRVHACTAAQESARASAHARSRAQMPRRVRFPSWDSCSF